MNKKDSKAPNKMSFFLSDLLGPEVSSEQFFSEYWQKKVLFLRPPEGASNRFDRHFAADELQEMWSNAAQSESGDLLVFCDTGVQSSLSSPFLCCAHRCSVVVNRADRYSRSVFRLCEALQESFPFVFCNVYYTPPGTQTVRKHSDDRDVLLLQIFGEKEWLIYNSPVALPYKDEELGKGAHPIDEATLTEPLRLTVKQGSVLYMPRGVVHEAHSNAKESSLHLTIALQSSDWDFATVLLGGLQSVLRSPSFQESRLCPSLCDLMHAAPHAPSTATLQTSERLVQQLLTTGPSSLWERSVSQHRERLERLRCERRQAAEDIRPIPLPVWGDTLVQWNPRVALHRFLAAPSAPPREMPFMTCVAELSMAAAAGGAGSTTTTMTTRLGCTKGMQQCLSMVAADPMVPHRVDELPMFDMIGKASAAIAFIDLQYFLRVS